MSELFMLIKISTKRNLNANSVIKITIVNFFSKSIVLSFFLTYSLNLELREKAEINWFVKRVKIYYITKYIIDFQKDI